MIRSTAVAMALPSPQRPVAATGGEFRDDDGADSLLPIFGFCAIGLLLGCIVSLLPLNAALAPLELPLILLGAPLAAVLGFSLGHRAPPSSGAPR
jgi:hypothetical protein